MLQIKWHDHVTNAEITGLLFIVDTISRRRWGLFRHVARLDNGVPARNALDCAFARPPAVRLAGEDHPDVQGRAGCTRSATGPQPQSAKNGQCCCPWPWSLTLFKDVLEDKF